MAIDMNCASRNTYTPAFTGKWSKTENGNSYYKTDNGLKVGATLLGINALSLLAKNNRIGLGLASTCLTMASSIGCGIIYDIIRNKKAQEAADYIKNVGVEKALDTRKDLAISTKRKVYFDNSKSTKDSTIMGALAGIPLGLMSTLHAAKIYKGTKNQMNNTMKALTFISTIPFYALGGYIMGKIANHYTNKDAEENA